jgi:ferredoxin-NADP reductase
VDLLVKLYPTGKMSKVFGKLAVGDTLLSSAPIGGLPHTSLTNFDQIGIVYGGTGITPMLSVIIAAGDDAPTQGCYFIRSINRHSLMVLACRCLHAFKSRRERCPHASIGRYQ